MNQATEPSEDSDAPPASAEGGEPAVEKSKSRARKKAAPAPEERAEGVVEATAEPVAEQELRPEPAEGPRPEPAGGLRPSAEGGLSSGEEPVEGPAPAAGPPVADEGVAAPAVAAPAPFQGAPVYGAAQPAAAGRPERRRGGRYPPRRKVCSFCVDHVDEIDYKEAGKLRRYLSDRGKIEPRRKTGTCAKHQRRLTIALKRARHLALLPYTSEHMRLTGSPAPRS